MIVGRTFKHPDLLFQLDFPPDWQVNNGKSAVVAAPEQGDVALVLQAANRGEASLRDYVDEILRQREAISTQVQAVRVSGSPALLAEYDLVVEGTGTLRLRDLFVDYRGLAYELMGYARDSDFARYRDTMDRWQRSFRPLPVAEAASYHPDRLDVFRTRQAGAFSSADLPMLALINALYPDAPVPSGSLLKRVTAGYSR